MPTVPMPLCRAESSGWTETSRHLDVLSFLDALSDHRLYRTSFGVTPEGRELPLLVLSTHGATTPAAARAAGLPVVLVLCGIHAGEVEGKEALLMLVRDLLADHHPGVLERITLLVIPLYNADGNDRIDPQNRLLDLPHLTGQIGPVTGVGTRVNAAGINLNRDYLRQDALETRLLHAGAMLPWAPDLVIDCHSTNGSVHRFNLTYDTPHTVESGRGEPIRFMRESFLPEVSARVRAGSGRETFFYGNFADDEGEAGEGWMTYTHHPRFGCNYRGLTNRLDLLLETYSYQDYEERTRTTYQFVLESLRLVGERGPEVRALVDRCATPPSRVAVRYRLDVAPEPARILTRSPRTLDGAPIEVTLPHRSRFTGTVVVDRPWAYAIPEPIGRRLAGHGLLTRVLPGPRAAPVEIPRITAIEGTGSRGILEASAERLLQAEFSRAERTLPAGTWLVETDQPLGAIAVYLCEPESDDGLLACGWADAERIMNEGGEWPVLRVREPIH